MKQDKNTVHRRLGGWNRTAALAGLILVLVALVFVAANSVGRFERAKAMTLKYGWGQYVQPSLPGPVFAFRCWMHDLTANPKGCMPTFRYALSKTPANYLYAAIPGALGMLIVLFGLFAPGEPPEEPAEGRLAEEKDLKEPGWISSSPDGKPDPGALFLGLYPADILAKDKKRRKTLQLPPSELQRHVLVEAGTREGKTSTFVENIVMSAARAGYTTILWDQKFRDHSGLAKTALFYRYYDHKVFMLTPYEPGGMRVPMLDLVTDFKSAKALAEALIAPSGDESVDYYRQLERELFAVMALAVSLRARAERRPARISEIIDIISTKSPEEILAYLEDVARYATGDKDNPYYWGKVVFENNKKAGKLTDNLISMRTKLSVFKHNPHVDRATSRGRPEENLDLRALFADEYGPALLYLGFPKEEVASDSFPVLLRLFKVTIDRFMSLVSGEGGKLPRQVIYMLDEFQNFGAIPRINKALAVDGSAGISYMILVQDRSALYEEYSKAEADAILGNNTGNKFFYLGGLDPKVTAELEELIGNRSIVGESNRHPAHFLDRLEIQEQRSLETKPVLPREIMQRAPRGTVLARLHYAPWTLYQSVLLSDPRNPLHHEYLEAMALADRFADELEAVSAKSEANESDASDRLKEVMEPWIRTLLDLAAPVRVVNADNPRLVIDRMPKDLLPSKLRRKAVITPDGIAIPLDTLDSDPELLFELYYRSELVQQLRQLRADGRVWYISAGGVHPIDNPETKTSLAKASQQAAIIVDGPSGDVFTHIARAPHLADYKLTPDPYRAQALGFASPDQWHTLPAGPLSYGLHPDHEIEARYLSHLGAAA